jgi:hypothetical protein
LTSVAQYLPGRPVDTVREFSQTLLHAIDTGFLTLGDVMVEPLYGRIERAYQIRREEIPERLPDFHRALQETLGAGAKVVERHIAKDLYGRLGFAFENHPDWTLVEYVNDVKRKVMQK